MKTGPSSIVISFGAIFLSFGIVFLIVELLAATWGHSRSLGVMLGVGSLVIGAVLAGAGTMMARSRDDRRVEG